MTTLTRDKNTTTADELYALLTSDPTEWEIGKYYATHLKSRIQYWVGNGLFGFTHESGPNPRLGLFNRISLYYWLMGASRNQIARTIK